MEKAGTIAQHLNNGSQTQAGRKPKQHDQTEMLKINSIFEIFNTNYTFWMHNKDLTAAKMLWLNKLHHVTAETAAVATDKALTAYPERAPTVGQFLGLCRVEPAHKEFQRALPPPPPTQGIAESNIQKMREALK